MSQKSIIVVTPCYIRMNKREAVKEFEKQYWKSETISRDLSEKGIV